MDQEENGSDQSNFMIDCHCHLCAKEFDEDLDKVVEKAKSVGVKSCLVNTENIEEFDKCLRLSSDYPGFCIPCAGVHPVQYEKTGEFVARSVRVDDMKGVDEWFERNQHKIVAIGETGLDFTPRYIKDDSDKEAQREVLKMQIKLANKYDLPLICHSRSAGAPLIKFLIENNVKNVLLHAPDCSKKSAMPGIAAGFNFSMPPSSIHSDQKKKLIEAIPLEQLMLETDSPVLGPNKEERNEPMNLKISCELIAEIKKTTVENIRTITTQNAFRLFPRLKTMLK